MLDFVPLAGLLFVVVFVRTFLVLQLFGTLLTMSLDRHFVLLSFSSRVWLHDGLALPIYSYSCIYSWRSFASYTIFCQDVSSLQLRPSSFEVLVRTLRPTHFAPVVFPAISSTLCVPLSPHSEDLSKS